VHELPILSQECLRTVRPLIAVDVATCLGFRKVVERIAHGHELRVGLGERGTQLAGEHIRCRPNSRSDAQLPVFRSGLTFGPSLICYNMRDRKQETCRGGRHGQGVGQTAPDSPMEIYGHSKPAASPGTNGKRAAGGPRPVRDRHPGNPPARRPKRPRADEHALGSLIFQAGLRCTTDADARVLVTPPPPHPTTPPHPPPTTTPTPPHPPPPPQNPHQTPYPPPPPPPPPPMDAWTGRK